MRKGRVKVGEWNFISDVSGKKFKSSEMRLRWDGIRCHKSEWNPRNEQDFLKGHPDNPQVPWTRPDNNNDTNVTTVDGKTLFTLNCAPPASIPGVAIPGCAIPGWSKGYKNPL